jgi:hypothetical protein
MDVIEHSFHFRHLLLPLERFKNGLCTVRTQFFVHILNMRTPPAELSHALHHAIQRAVIKYQGERDNGETRTEQQLECFCKLSQQNVLQSEQLIMMIRQN